MSERRFKCGRDDCWVAGRCLHKTGGLHCWEQPGEPRASYVRRPLRHYPTGALKRELEYRGDVAPTQLTSQDRENDDDRAITRPTMDAKAVALHCPDRAACLFWRTVSDALRGHGRSASRQAWSGGR